MLRPFERDDAANLEAVISDLKITASETFGDAEFARKWLNLPNPALEGGIPLELAKTKDGVQRVAAILTRIAHGVYD